MKKSLFFFAAAAIALTACTNDDDALQTGQVQNSNRAVAFDTYTAGTTRAGDPEGVMTTDKLKTDGKGFGVFAFYHNNSDWAHDVSTILPNFMFNEHVSWAGGWSYSPLKYWPNETLNDNQDPNAVMPGPGTPGTNLDKLSFFAYAPYVATGGTNTLATKATNMETNRTSTDKKSAYEATTPADNKYGILRVSAEDLVGDPLVEWRAYTNVGDGNNITTPWNNILDHNVDLLWGVASADADYTSVNNTLVDTKFGMPLKDLIKPDKDQRVKFLFQHALSRIGLTVVSAIDQISGGDDGGKYNNAQTRVLIEDVTVWGNFGIQGVLNLDNTSTNKANWIWTSVNRTASTDAAPILLVNKTNGYLASDLRYDPDGTIIPAIETGTKHLSDLNEGVLPSEKNLLAGGVDDHYLLSTTPSNPAFKHGRPLYKQSGNDYVLATATATLDASSDVYTKDDNGNYNKVATGVTTFDKMDAITKYYTIVPTVKDAASDNINVNDEYYTVDISGNYIYHKADAAITTTFTYYTIAETQIPDNKVGTYGTDTYWTRLSPRYFMVIPTETGEKTDVYVQITYRIITEDAKLGKNISNIQNVITKKESFAFEDGKSYNLKLILGLTSVKLDATVGEWQVADDAEIWLPKNVE